MKTALRLNFQLSLNHVLHDAKSSQRATRGHETESILRKSNKHNKSNAFFEGHFPSKKIVHVAFELVSCHDPYHWWIFFEGCG